MKLPDITPAATPPAPTGELGQLANEQRRFGSVIEQGLTAYGQELVKAQTQQAAAKLTEKLGVAEQRIRAQPFVPASYLKQQFGEDLAGIQDPAVRDQVKALAAQDPTKDALVPTWVVAGTLYDKHANEALAESSKSITAGQGWQAAFQDQVAGHIAQRKVALNDEQLKGMHEYLKQLDTQSATSFVNAGDFPSARQVVLGSRTLDAPEKTKAFQAIDAAEQTKPIWDALRAHDVVKEKALLAELDKKTALTPQQREEFAKHLEHDIKTIDLADGSRKMVDQLLTEAGGDPAKAAELAKRITDTPLFDAVDARLKKQVLEANTMRAASDAPRVARLEVGIDQTSALDRASKDYAELSDMGRATVEAKFLAAKRASRTANAQDRAIQAEADQNALRSFQLLSPAEQARANVDEMFAGQPVSRNALLGVKIEQKKAIAIAAKGLTPKHDEVQAAVTAYAQTLYGTDAAGKAKAAKLHGEVMSWWTGEVAKKDGELPTREEVNQHLAGAILYGTVPGWAYGTNEATRIQAQETGKEFTPYPPEKQPAKVREALTKLRGGAPAPAAPAARPSPKPGMKHITNGKQGGWIDPADAIPAGWKEG